MSSKYNHIGRELFVIFRSQVEKITHHGHKSVEGKVAKKCLTETVENLKKIGNFALTNSEEVAYVSQLIREYKYPGTISIHPDLKEEHNEFKAANPNSAEQTQFEAIEKKLLEHPEVKIEDYDAERHEIDNDNFGKKGGPSYPKGSR